MMLKRIIGSIFLMLIGGVLVYYSREFVKWFGRNKWYEEKIGSTESMYILLGFLFIFLGFWLLFRW